MVERMRLPAGLAAALVLASSSAAPAFAPRRGDEHGLVVAGRPARAHRATERAAPTAARTAFAPLATAGWQALWDRDTGVPLRLWGGVVAAPGAVGDPAVAERVARAFLAAHLAVLAPGAVASDFVVVANQRDGDVRTVGLRQTASGLPVLGGQLGFVFAHDRLFAVGSEALPGVHVTASRGGPAATGRAEAWVAAETGHRVATRGTGARAILPIIRAPGDLEYRVVDVLDVAALDGPERWDVYVAPDGEPVARKSRLLPATGTLAYNAGVRYAAGPRTDFPASAAAITVDAAATTTAADGTFAWASASPATVTPSASGPTVQVTNQAGAPVTGSLVVQPGGHVTWDLSTDEFGDAQLSTFVYASLVIARDRLINPAIATWLAGPLTFFVNEPGSCNAYSTGTEVHLFQASAQCENTGRLADVVFHEFGHSVHYHSIIAGMGAFDISLSEGLADYNAANLNEDPAIGRGFYRTDEALRDIDPEGLEKVWPDDQNADPHLTGLIVSGALWDLRKALIRDLGHDAGVAQAEAIFTGIMQRAADIPSSYVAALIADDDDANLGNGTPHQCAIEHAFGIHGLVGSDFHTTTVGTPVLDGLTISIPTDTPAAATCPVPQVTSIAVTWKIGDGVASAFELQPQGAVWSGTFPPQPDGTVIAYAIDASLDDGSHVVLPNNPADPMYQLFVGQATPIWCEPFDRDPHWVQSGNLGDEWQWGPPTSNPASGDPRSAHTGSNLLGTAISGYGYYQASEMTSIVTPPIDVSSFDVVHLQYWRWLTVEDATYDHAAIAVDDAPLWQNASSPGGTLDHIDKEWRFHDLEVTPYVMGGTATIQWSLRSDASKELGGWAIDDVCLVGLGKHAVCGDGVLDPGEQCDDGNTTDHDGCSATCLDELTAGGGGCSTGRGGASGSLALGLGLLALVRRRRPVSAIRPHGTVTHGSSAAGVCASRCSSRWPSRSVSERMP